MIHARHERAGLLRFRVYQNDGAAESLIALMHCKSIYGKQLPKMPKEYITRLVLDRRHVSLACCMRGEIEPTEMRNTPPAPAARPSPAKAATSGRASRTRPPPAAPPAPSRRTSYSIRRCWT